MNDRIAGHLEVGTDGDGNVAINHGMTHVDESGNGHFAFSCRQARKLAISLLTHAESAEAEEQERMRRKKRERGRGEVTKYYLAARYSRREELLRYARQLEELGHEVTSRWIRGDHEMPEIGDADSTDEAFNAITDAQRAEIGRSFALDDLDDLMNAECLIAFTETPGKAKGRGRGGRHVELGFALALHSLRLGDYERGLWMRRIVIVGPRENVFCCLDGIDHFEDWPSCLASLIHAETVEVAP